MPNVKYGTILETEKKNEIDLGDSPIHISYNCHFKIDIALNARQETLIPLKKHTYFNNQVKNNLLHMQSYAIEQERIRPHLR